MEEAFPQFHTLSIPQLSNHVTETQTLAVTDITIDYSSPSVNDRDVWNDPNVIPQKGEPIAWRAGANMNTTISFSTDVTINGEALSAGKYGLHIIPDKEKYTILFAHANDLWGSYYLDVDQDVTLSVEVDSEACTFSEKLDFEFLNWTEEGVDVGLEWAEKRISFSVAVNLSETVLASFRSELRGENTYRWESWNDAALWCYGHEVNMEEALAWANRSIEGGSGGFGANKNFSNVSTKISILNSLGKKEERAAALSEIQSLDYSAYEAHQFCRNLMHSDDFSNAQQFNKQAMEKYPEAWYLVINKSLLEYFLGNTSKAVKTMDKAIAAAPTQYKERLTGVIEEMNAGTYKLL